MLQGTLKLSPSSDLALFGCERTHEILGDIEMPSPSPRVCTAEGRSCGDVIIKFSRLDGYQFSLSMVLHWRANALKLRDKESDNEADVLRALYQSKFLHFANHFSGF